MTVLSKDGWCTELRRNFDKMGILFHLGIA